MKIVDLLKHAYIRTGLNQARFAMKIGVSEPYVSYIAQRMEPDYQHLLPKTSKSVKVQNEIKELIQFELSLFEKDTEKETVCREN